MSQFFKVTILSIFTLFFFLPYLSLALNPFHACTPKKCGDLLISYPFYIEDQQEPFCGYQGFQVACNSENETIINLSDDTYVIKDIFYGNQSVHIVNTAFLDDAFNCSPVIHNLTLEGRFEFAFNHSEVIFLQNCTNDVEKSLAQFIEFSCVVGEGRRQVLAAYKSDSSFRDLAGKCGRVILVPYEQQGGSDIEGVLRKGLLLQWIAANCSNDCLQSGGRCVYNSTASQAQCFCLYGASDKCHTSESLSLLPLSGLLISSSLFVRA